MRLKEPKTKIIISIILLILIVVLLATVRIYGNNEPPCEYEVVLLARVLYTEARGECRDGQLMVAQCVLDRLETGKWGNSLEDVILAPRQFARLGRATDELKEVARAALMDERFMENKIILFFRVFPNNSDWYAPYLITIGNHRVYGYVRELEQQNKK